MTPNEIVKLVEGYSESFEKWSIASFTPLSLMTRILTDNLNITKVKAERYAEKAVPLLIEKINKKIADYDQLGAHPPIFWLNNSQLVGTYKNKKCDFKFNWEESKRLNDYINNACPKRMLLISILFTACRNYSFAEVVDGSNDGGIDIIAKKPFDDLIDDNRVLFIQSKKCSTTLDKKTFIYEDAFFKDSLVRSQEVRRKYLTKLGVNPNTPTVDIKYIFISNGRFTDTIKDYAIRSNILLLNSFLLAQIITAQYSDLIAIETLEKWFSEKRYSRGEVFYLNKL